MRFTRSAGSPATTPQGSEDGEIDFVLAKVGEPIICLEVKGGGLECRHGEWFRLKDGGPERFRDPFAQALDHIYDLARNLADPRILGGAGRPHRSGAVLPRHLGPQARPRPRRAIRDRDRRNGLADLAAADRTVLAYHRGSRDKRAVLDVDGLDALREILAPNVRIEVPMADAASSTRKSS